METKKRRFSGPSLTYPPEAGACRAHCGSDGCPISVNQSLSSTVSNTFSGGRKGEEVSLDNRVHDMLVFYVNTSSWLQRPRGVPDLEMPYRDG